MVTKELVLAAEALRWKVVAQITEKLRERNGDRWGAIDERASGRQSSEYPTTPFDELATGLHHRMLQSTLAHFGTSHSNRGVIKAGMCQSA